MIFSLFVCGTAAASENKTTAVSANTDALIGDANGDGKLSISDATAVQRHLASLELLSEEQLQLAKVSGNTELTVTDATLIQKKVAKMIDKFPLEEQQASTESGKDTLVVYFSRTGNTKPLAGYAAQYLDADIYEIEAAVPYTDADIAYYTNCRADKEQSDPDARPEIAGKIDNITQYKTILLGYPIWHGQAPKIIYTFLESYDFSGKTIVPFCTSHSSGVGSSATNLHALAPNAEWKDGRRFAIGTSEAAIQEWIDSLGIKQENNRMKMTINGNPVTVDWEDNDAVSALQNAVKDNPLTIQTSMYGGFEQVGSLGMDLPRNDTQITTQPGDVILYSGNQMVVFYGSNTWAYTRLGKITDKTDAELQTLLSNGNVTIVISA
jgi:flavodoxin